MTNRIVHLVALSLLVACARGPSPDLDFADPPSAEELYRQGMEDLEGGRFLLFFHTRDYTGAIDAFQNVIDNYPYSEYAVLAELRIADSYYDQKLYEEALSYYRDFGDLHPDHEKVPYTIYRAGLSYYHQSHDPGRDQTATRQAISNLDQLLNEYPHSPYAEEAEALWRDLRSRLADHAMDIGNFYMDREEYQSAADRFRSVLNDYPGLGVDAEALYKLGICYKKMNLDDEATRVFEVILENYQGSDIARAARDLVPAAN